MKDFDRICCSKTKTYSYLMDDGWSDKKAKGTKKCVIKRRLKLMITKTVL